MSCPWHGEGKFIFSLSLGKMMLREMGKVCSLELTCPGSPCAALRGKVAGLSLGWHPRRDAQGQT